MFIVRLFNPTKTAVARSSSRLPRSFLSSVVYWPGSAMEKIVHHRHLWRMQSAVVGLLSQGHSPSSAAPNSASVYLTTPSPPFHVAGIAEPAVYST